MAYAPIGTFNQTTPNVAAQTTVVIPKGHSILQIVVHNTTGNAVTGGIKIGTSIGGADVVSALAVAENSLFVISDAHMLKSIFSLTEDTPIYIDAVGLFNSASLDFIFVLRKIATSAEVL